MLKYTPVLFGHGNLSLQSVLKINSTLGANFFLSCFLHFLKLLFYREIFFREYLKQSFFKKRKFFIRNEMPRIFFKCLQVSVCFGAFSFSNISNLQTSLMDQIKWKPSKRRKRRRNVLYCKNCIGLPKLHVPES